MMSSSTVWASSQRGTMVVERRRRRRRRRRRVWREVLNARVCLRTLLATCRLAVAFLVMALTRRRAGDIKAAPRPYINSLRYRAHGARITSRCPPSPSCAKRIMALRRGRRGSSSGLVGMRSGGLAAPILSGPTVGVILGMVVASFDRAMHFLVELFLLWSRQRTIKTCVRHSRRTRQSLRPCGRKKRLSSASGSPNGPPHIGATRFGGEQ
mmetsp:Transcript_82696/g.165025  ORF Transcript_82696/g.165025 Transcript_82696/m.165025 type:complete len:211 (+) Transcript_82696:298-930(+)